MKIIEALKEIPLLEKRIHSNIAKINEYAAGNDTGAGGHVFDTADKQKAEVAALLQANEDLVKRRSELRRQLYLTNASVKVNIDGTEKTISEWIEYREKGFDLLQATYAALNDQVALNKVRSIQYNPETGIKTVRFYSEADKNDKINKTQALRDQLDARLEMVNATTDLVALPA